MFNDENTSFDVDFSEAINIGGEGLTPEQEAEINANSEARHTHGNKDALDGITQSMIDDLRSGVVTHHQLSEYSVALDENFNVINARLDAVHKVCIEFGNIAQITPYEHIYFGEVESLTVDFAPPEELEPYRNEYSFTFISGATPTVLTLPDTIKWVNELTIEANKRYEISIVDNIGLWCAVEVSV